MLKANFVASFFIRLYFYLFLSILISSFISFLIIDKFSEYDGVEDFILDTILVKNILEKKRTIENEKFDSFYLNINSQSYPFDIEWLGDEDILTLCKQCSFLNSDGNVEVYKLEDGKLLSIHSLEGTLEKLIIKDKEEKVINYEGDVDNFDIENYSIVILLNVVIVVVGVVLYINIRKLQKDIYHLTITSDSFGNGDLESRANVRSYPLKALADSFNEMAISLSNKVNESQIFSQAVPHELRTPLTRIQLASDILRKNITNIKLVALLDNIDEYITDIDDLCSQVIQFSKLNLSSESHNHAEFELNSYIQSRISLLTSSSSLNIHFNFTENIIISCDITNFRLIIDNLITNALYYSHSMVIVEVNRVENLLEICIEDDGGGIPESEYKNIFLPYARIDNSRTRKTGGIGMGLAIVKLAINHIGGEVSIKKSIYGGAQFKIKLPASTIKDFL